MIMIAIGDSTMVYIYPNAKSATSEPVAGNDNVIEAI
jgi:hypothetical protein